MHVSTLAINTSVIAASHLRVEKLRGRNVAHKTTNDLLDTHWLNLRQKHNRCNFYVWQKALLQKAFRIVRLLFCCTNNTFFRLSGYV